MHAEIAGSDIHTAAILGDDAAVRRAGYKLKDGESTVPSKEGPERLKVRRGPRWTRKESRLGYPGRPNVNQ